MIKPKSKLPQTGTTIFTIMSALANQYKAINLGQGFPDFPMNKELIELVNKSMREGMNQYTHSNGYPELRNTISEKISMLYSASVNPDEQITITPGATYGIFTAISSVIFPGDEVIMFEPAYDCYIPAILLNGGIPKRIAMNPDDFSIPWEEVKNNINSKTKAIIINSPHNPTGTILTEQDIQQLHQITQNTDIIIISDEVYEHLIFDNLKHESILKYSDLLARSFVCFSFGKTYHCTGWKIGYVVSSPELMKEFRSIHQFNAFSVDTPKQYALAEYLKNQEMYLTLGKSIQTKRDYFRELMSDTAFVPVPSSGSYFECYSYKNFSKEPDKDFAIRLVKEYGVATIPVSAFYADGKDDQLIRFCFAKEENTLYEAAERLKSMKF